jgi:putative endonuclease
MRDRYVVYILECADGTFYIGSTNNLEKRLDAHNIGKTGAKYTKGRRPVVLRYKEEIGSRGDALRREVVLKRLSRTEKSALCLGSRSV